MIKLLPPPPPPPPPPSLVSKNVLCQIVTIAQAVLDYRAVISIQVPLPLCHHRRFLSVTACQKACGPPCPIKGQVFQGCRTCPATCNNPNLICTAVCRPGCGCPPGMVGTGLDESKICSSQLSAFEQSFVSSNQRSFIKVTGETTAVTL